MQTKTIDKVVREALMEEFRERKIGLIVLSSQEKQ